MTNSCQEFISTYVKASNHRNSSKLILLYKLPLITRWKDGKCIYIEKKGDLSKYIKNKLRIPSSFFSLEHVGNIGNRFVLLKQKTFYSDLSEASNNIVAEKFKDNYLIIAEAILNDICLN